MATGLHRAEIPFCHRRHFQCEQWGIKTMRPRSKTRSFKALTRHKHEFVELVELSSRLRSCLLLRTSKVQPPAATLRVGLWCPESLRWHRLMRGSRVRRGSQSIQSKCRDGGFHSHGNTPIAGWFIMENLIYMDDDWGHYFRKAPYRQLIHDDRCFTGPWRVSLKWARASVRPSFAIFIFDVHIPFSEFLEDD